MRVLVTGGCGFIGSSIVEELLENGHEVAVIDNLSTGDRSNLDSRARLFILDITGPEMKNVFNKVRPEVVYHQAAQVDVQASIKTPSFDADINIMGTLKVLECCREYGVKKIVFASSAAVYGQPRYLSIRESHPLMPISFYGISKYAAELYIYNFCKIYNMEYTILRYANVYGEKQGSKGEGGVVSIFLKRMLWSKEIFIYGNGEQTRDLIYVKDVAKANVAALSNGSGEVINISTNKSVSINNLYKLLGDILQYNKEPLYKPAREGDIEHSYLNNTKAKELLDWQQQFSLQEGLQETIKYYIGGSK